MGLSPANSPATSSVSILVSVMAMTMILLAGRARADIDKDRAECTDQLIGLATCLPYVGGEAKAPTLDCCSGLKVVLQKSIKCLCILIKDRDDPKLGLNINVTLALGLPTSCHTPTNLTRCVDLLHLASNSTDAKLFEDFDETVHAKNSTLSSSNNGNSSSSSSSPASAASKSDGGQRKKLGSMEMVFMGLSALFFTLPHHIF